jgi:hypothetical protein
MYVFRTNGKYGMVREEGEYQRVMAMGDKDDKASARKMRLAGTVA